MRGPNSDHLDAGGGGPGSPSTREPVAGRLKDVWVVCFLRALLSARLVPREGRSCRLPRFAGSSLGSPPYFKVPRTSRRHAPIWGPRTPPSHRPVVDLHLPRPVCPTTRHRVPHYSRNPLPRPPPKRLQVHSRDQGSDLLTPDPLPTPGRSRGDPGPDGRGPGWTMGATAGVGRTEGRGGVCVERHGSKGLVGFSKNREGLGP